ncbi:MAG: PhzF family phenazine biosynthesis protein [Planctomycetota bacterium]|nr:PhzF family phenazine biosynthesis protein [Planctomycetota bacterium]
MSISITQVDSFTDTPFRGNPAGVCVLSEPRSEQWMQNIAREMNLSETAFLVRNPDDVFHLRWFTPALEVDLCGHATLASAHVLWEEGHLDSHEVAKFDTLSGRLEARLDGDWISMNFPAEPPKAIDAPTALAQSIPGVTFRWVGANRLDYHVEVATEDEVRQVEPDFSSMKKLDVRGVIVTARANESSDYDFVSRYFAPLFGVDEDPVTGSAHCCLGPYWATKLNREEVVGYQASPRGGIVKVRPQGNRVQLSGQAITTMNATLMEAALEPTPSST